MLTGYYILYFCMEMLKQLIIFLLGSQYFGRFYIGILHVQLIGKFYAGIKVLKCNMLVIRPRVHQGRIGFFLCVKQNPHCSWYNAPLRTMCHAFRPRLCNGSRQEIRRVGKGVRGSATQGFPCISSGRCKTESVKTTPHPLQLVCKNIGAGRKIPENKTPATSWGKKWLS